MRLLLGDPVTGQKINDGLRFDLKFAGQFVNSDLIYVAHALQSTTTT